MPHDTHAGQCEPESWGHVGCLADSLPCRRPDAHAAPFALIPLARPLSGPAWPTKSSMRRSAGARRLGQPSETSRASPHSPCSLSQGCRPVGRAVWRLAARALGEQALAEPPAGAFVAAAATAAFSKCAPLPSSVAQMLHSSSKAAAFPSPAATLAALRPAGLLPAASPNLERRGLPAALVSAPWTSSRTAPSPGSALLHRVQLFNSGSVPDKAVGEAASTAPGNSAPSADSVGGSGTPGDGGSSGNSGGPGPDFKRWLDGMQQRGYSVAYDTDLGEIEIKGDCGRLLLYTKLRLLSEKEFIAAPKGCWSWKLACGAGGTFLMGEAYGPDLAMVYAGLWAFLVLPQGWNLFPWKSLINLFKFWF